MPDLSFHRTNKTSCAIKLYIVELSNFSKDQKRAANVTVEISMGYL
jgi:hypothetical protein